MANTPQGPKPFDIKERTFLFARDVLTAYPPEAWRHPPSAVVWRQLIRSAASVGANLEEADAGSSTQDFVHRIRIGLREAREARYWLRLIESAALEGRQAVEPLLQEASELIAILTAIAKKSDKKAKRP